jgi:hypothetical protein
MRVALASLAVFALVAVACGGGSSTSGSSSGASSSDGSSPSGPSGTSSSTGIEGTWKATSAVFVSVANSTKRTDVVAQGAVVTLVIASSGFTLTFFYPDRSPAVTTGSWTSSRDTLTLKPSGVSWSWQFDMSQNGNNLSLGNAGFEFDFSGTGVNEQAKLSMTLVRQ